MAKALDPIPVAPPKSEGSMLKELLGIVSTSFKSMKKEYRENFDRLQKESKNIQKSLTQASAKTQKENRDNSETVQKKIDEQGNKTQKQNQVSNDKLEKTIVEKTGNIEKDVNSTTKQVQKISDESKEQNKTNLEATKTNTGVIKKTTSVVKSASLTTMNGVKSLGIASNKGFRDFGDKLNNEFFENRLLNDKRINSLKGELMAKLSALKGTFSNGGSFFDNLMGMFSKGTMFAGLIAAGLTAIGLNPAMLQLWGKFLKSDMVKGAVKGTAKAVKTKVSKVKLNKSQGKAQKILQNKLDKLDDAVNKKGISPKQKAKLLDQKARIQKTVDVGDVKKAKGIANGKVAKTGKIANGVSKVKDIASKGAKGTGGMMKTLMEKVSWISSKVSPLFSKIFGIFGGVSKLGGFLKPMAALLKGVFLKIPVIGQVLTVGMALWDGFSAVFGAKGAGLGVGDKILMFFKETLMSVVSSFTGIPSAIAGLFGMLLGDDHPVVKVMKTIGDLFAGTMDGAVGYLFDFISGTVVKTLSGLWDTLKSGGSMISALFSGDFAGAWEHFKDFGIGLIKNTIGFLPNLIYNSVSSAFDVFSDITNSDWYINMVLNITDFFAELPGNISKGIQWVWDKMKGIINDVSSIFSDWWFSFQMSIAESWLGRKLLGMDAEELKAGQTDDEKARRERKKEEEKLAELLENKNNLTLNQQKQLEKLQKEQEARKKKEEEKDKKAFGFLSAFSGDSRAKMKEARDLQTQREKEGKSKLTIAEIASLLEEKKKRGSDLSIDELKRTIVEERVARDKKEKDQIAEAQKKQQEIIDNQIKAKEATVVQAKLSETQAKESAELANVVKTGSKLGGGTATVMGGEVKGESSYIPKGHTKESWEKKQKIQAQFDTVRNKSGQDPVGKAVGKPASGGTPSSVEKVNNTIAMGKTNTKAFEAKTGVSVKGSMGALNNQEDSMDLQKAAEFGFDSKEWKEASAREDERIKAQLSKKPAKTQKKKDSSVGNKVNYKKLREKRKEIMGVLSKDVKGQVNTIFGERKAELESYKLASKAFDTKFQDLVFSLYKEAGGKLESFEAMDEAYYGSDNEEDPINAMVQRAESIAEEKLKGERPTKPTKEDSWHERILTKIKSDKAITSDVDPKIIKSIMIKLKNTYETENKTRLRLRQGGVVDSNIGGDVPANIHKGEAVVSDLESERGDEWVDKIATKLIEKMGEMGGGSEEALGGITVVLDGIKQILSGQKSLESKVTSINKGATVHDDLMSFHNLTNRNLGI